MPEGFPSGAGIIVDERGSSVLVKIDPGLYSEDTALKAAYWLTDRCHIHVRKAPDMGLIAEIRLKDGSGGERLTAACGEFCNSLIDFSLRARVAEETKDIQEALLQRAFVQALPRSAGG